MGKAKRSKTAVRMNWETQSPIYSNICLLFDSYPVKLLRTREAKF